MQMKKAVSVLLAMILCLSFFTGCGEDEGVFYTSVEALPETLDPQLAQNDAECLIAVNIFMGLFRRGEDGTAQPAACESYKVSSDGLIWNFTLKDGLIYNDGTDEKEATPVQAEDYAFALKRVLAKDSTSPWAGTFSGIARDENGNPIVFSTGKKSLTIQLVQPDESLLLKLCCPGAMPCQKGFFEACEGAYGLDTKTVLTNGAFRISLLSEESGITLRRIDTKEGYLDKIRLLLMENSEEQQILSGSFTQGVPEYETPLYHVQTCILRINPQYSQLADRGVRAGLAGVMYQNLISSEQDGVSTAGGLIADSVRLGEISWRQIAGNLMAEALPQDPVTSFREGLVREGKNKLSGVTVLVPDTEEWHVRYDSIAIQWQQQLSAFFSVEYLPEEEIVRRVNQGDYQLAFYTHRAQDESVTAELEVLARQFGIQLSEVVLPQEEALPQDQTDENTQTAVDTAGGEPEVEQEEAINPQSQTVLQAIDFTAVYATQTREQQIQALKAAELTLLSNCVAVPLYTVTEYYAVETAFSHISVSPFGPMLDFYQALWSEE